MLRSILVLALAAASIHAQYLTVRTAAPNTSGGLFRNATLRDIDGNGLPELFLQGATLRIVPNVWTATPAQISNPPTVLATCGAHVLANVNGDPYPDLALLSLNGFGFVLSIMPGLPGGAFAPAAAVASFTHLGWSLGGGFGSNVRGPMVANDFDGDGLDDILIFSELYMGVIFNAGGAWTPGWSQLSAVFHNYARVADFNGDGLKDLVFGASASPQPVYVWYGIPGGFAANPTLVPPPAGTTWGVLFDAGDVDQDGYADVVMRHFMPPTAYGMSGLWVMYGGPAGLAYVPESAITLPSSPTQFSMQFAQNAGDIVDIDADGLNDIVGITYGQTYGQGTSLYTMARGLGGRAFFFRWLGGHTALPPLDGAPLYADLDADGDMDMFAVSDVGYTHSLLENRATIATACFGSGGTPGFPISPAWWGNPTFTLGLSGGPPNALGALIVSTATYALPFCGPGPSFNSWELVMPSGSFGFFTTSAAGTASFTTALPAIPAFYGLQVYAQWAALDLGGAFPAFGSNWALTATRKILVF